MFRKAQEVASTTYEYLTICVLDCANVLGGMLYYFNNPRYLRILY